MAYTYEQLTKAYAAVHGGIEPKGEAAAQLLLLTNASFTDADRLNYILNSADDSTAVAVLTYQFFTGKSPKADGIAWLLNSADNASDLNDPAFANFNLEHRFMNFAASLAMSGDGKVAFEAKYGALTYAGYVASIYDSIIGTAQARAAGLNPETIIQDVIARQDLILASARAAGMVGPNATAAEIDLALKTATAAYLLAEGIKADVGIYAAATNNFMLGLAKGDAVYNTDITQTYAPNANSGSSGTGKAVDNPPPIQSLPGAPPPPPPPEPEPELPAPPPPPSSQTFVLTTGDDVFTGGDADDTFTATNLTFGYNETLKGGAGHDTLNVVATVDAGNSWYSMPNDGVTGIETINITSNVGVSAYIPYWADVTHLNASATGGISLTANANAKITADTAQGAANVSIYGGSDITVTSTGATTGKITIGATDLDDKPTGDVVVSRELIGNNAAESITVHGGKTVSITQTANTAPGDLQYHGEVTVYGSTLTTEVTVKAETPFSDGSSDLLAKGVTIEDFTVGKNTPGTITTVSIDGYDTAQFAGTALTTLSLSHGLGDVVIDNSGLLTPTNKTLNLAINDLQIYSVNSTYQGVIRDIGVYTTLNITTGAVASEVADLGFGAVTALTVKGDSALKLISAAGLGALETLTISGAAGVNGVFSSAALTSVSTAASTGANTLTFDGSKASFIGGAGVDTITLSGASVSKSISLGGGDDRLILTSATSVDNTAVFDGGAGTDTVEMSSALAVGYAGPAFQNFETLVLANTGSKTISASAFTGFKTITVSGTGTVTLNGVPSSTGLTTVTAIDAAGLSGDFTRNATLTLIDASGTSGDNTLTIDGSLTAFKGGEGVDTVSVGPTAITHAISLGNGDDRLVLTNATSLTAALDGGAGTDTLVLKTAFLSTPPSQPFDITNFEILELANTGVTTLDLSTFDQFQSLKFTGAGTLNISATHASVTSIDASAMTATYFGVTTGASTAAMTVRGQTTGENYFQALSATGKITYTGSAGDDFVHLNDGAHVIDLGSGGADTVAFGDIASNATTHVSITGFGENDKVSFADYNGANSATALGAAQSGGLSTLQANLDAAAAGNGGLNSLVKWFQFGGDTYIVLDNSSAATFQVGQDQVIKLVGVGIELAGSTYGAGTLTYQPPS